MDVDQINKAIRLGILSVVDDLLPESPQIVIEQRDGEVTVVSKPRGVELCFYNFDLTGKEDPDILSTWGPSGERFLEQHWSEKDEVTRNDSASKGK